MRAKITIADVAREAGVGTTTVSRVINGGKLVAPDVRARIEKIMRKLDYQPSSAARSLAQEQSRSIGLILPGLTDPFYALIAQTAQEICRANAHTLLISTSSDKEEQTIEELIVFKQHRVDGLLLISPARQSAQFKNHCKYFGKSVVSLDIPLEMDNISSVQTDNSNAMAEATKHFIAHGRRRLLCLASNMDFKTTRLRRDGYETTMQQARLKPRVQEHVYSFEMAERAILEMARSRAGLDGVLTTNGTLGILAFQVLQKHGLQERAKVGLITFDDPPLADTLRPAVTAVVQPIEEMTRIAAELLLFQMRNPDAKAQHIQLASRLIVRDSCGCRMLS